MVTVLAGYGYHYGGSERHVRNDGGEFGSCGCVVPEERMNEITQWFWMPKNPI